MARRITGFSREAGTYIERHPGKTAQDIVRSLLQSGSVQSAADNPEGSLVATLHKHHKQIGVERRWDSGVYRYYPKNGQSPPLPPPPKISVDDQPEGDKVLVKLWLPQAVTDVADTLVASGVCENRGEAVSWLIGRGISAIRLNR